MSDLHDKSMDILHEAAGIKRDGLAGLLAWIQARREAETVQRREIERLRAEVRDLKARLRACRGEIQYTSSWKTTPSNLARFTDLRRKNWRKP